MTDKTTPTCIELCCGAGGMALGLERAGWEHRMLVEFDRDAALSIKRNNPTWPVKQMDLTKFPPSFYPHVDMVCGGPPCQPFSTAGNRRGENDVRDVFLSAVELAVQIRPRLIMFENVPGLLHAAHKQYRHRISSVAGRAGYRTRWLVFPCSRWGVPQTRRRVLFVAVRGMRFGDFPPLPPPCPGMTVREAFIQSGVPPDQIPDAFCAPKFLLPTITARGMMGAGPTPNRNIFSLGLSLGALRKLHSPVIWRCRFLNGLGVHPTTTYKIKEKHITGYKNRPTPSQLILPSWKTLAALQTFQPGYEFVGNITTKLRQIGNAFPPYAAYQVGVWAKTLLTLTD